MWVRSVREYMEQLHDMDTLMSDLSMLNWRISMGYDVSYYTESIENAIECIRELRNRILDE